MKGTKYRKCDLQIHTPASKDFDGTATAEDIVLAAIARGLEIIAITDHNTVEFVDNVRQTAKGRPIHVFPGVEISAANAHILAIFDHDCPLERINDLLARVDILAEMRGRQDVVGGDAETVISEIHKLGGVAIAAHANSSNGLLRTPKGQYKIKLCNMPELMALEFTNEEDINKFSTGAVPGYPKKACVQSSDAHTLAQIGQRFTYLKMDYVSLHGIRQALLDHEIKVKFAWHDITTRGPRIVSLSLSQGFFEGTVFEFHPHLNCLVGGKGTGKSTVIELMRYAFDYLSAFDDIQEDSLGKALALVGPGGTISVICADESGQEFVIERVVDEEHRGEPICRDNHGEICAVPFWPVFFSQGELARLASSPLAQMSLIDAYLDLEEESRKEQEGIDAIRENAADILQCNAEIARLLAEVNDPTTGKKVIQAEVKRLEQALREPILSEFPKWEAEQRFIDDRILGLKSAPELLRDALQRVDIDDLFGLELAEDAPSADLLGGLSDLPEKIGDKVYAAGSSLAKELEEMLQGVENTKGSWEAKFAAKKKEYEAFVSRTQEKTIVTLQAKLGSLKKKLERLEKAEKDAKKWQDFLREREGAREKALEELRACRIARYQKRLEIAKRWEEKLDRKIKIEIALLGDRREYSAQLKEMLKGSWIQEKDQRLVVMGLDPHALARAIRIGNVSALTNMGVAAEPAAKIVEFLKQKPADLFNLEAVMMPDLPGISFEVSPNTYRPLNALSVGQKGTVVISLAMVEGKAPLIIDQPEDSLDTVFIYEQIVKKLREEKESRQSIFATHNANLLVTTDADLSFVMEATADKGEIQSHGGMDRKATKDLLLLHLEGGEIAFGLRAMKYGK